MRLLGCFPGSPSAHAGLRFGDIPIAVDGAPYVDACIAAKGCRDGRTAAKIVRDGRELEIELKRSDWEFPSPDDDAAEEPASSRENLPNWSPPAASREAEIRMPAQFVAARSAPRN